MYWQCRHEVHIALIGLEFRQRRTIFPNLSVHLGETCVTSFCQFKFLEKVANPTIAVITTDDMFFLHVVIGEWWQRPLNVIYRYSVWIYVYFNWIAVVPRFMIHSIFTA